LVNIKNGESGWVMALSPSPSISAKKSAGRCWNGAQSSVLFAPVPRSVYYAKWTRALDEPRATSRTFQFLRRQFSGECRCHFQWLRRIIKRVESVVGHEM
jgi:hypothetical protein